MGAEKEEKKTLWDRFTSWVAASWPGRVVKWIADHTGISWALGKIKNLFGGKDAGNGASKEGTTTPKSPEGNGKGHENGPSPEPVAPKIAPVADDAEKSQGETQKSSAANKENVIQGYIEILRNKDGEEQLMLKVSGYLITSLQKWYKNPTYVQSYENVYQITYTNKYDHIGKTYCFPIISVKRQGIEGDAFCELDEMKNILGFNGSKKSIAITEISPEPFTPEVESPESAAPKSPKGKKPERKVNGPNPGNPQPVKPEMLKEVGQAKFKQYFSCDKDKLLLVVTNEIYQDLKDNHKNKDNKEEFRTIIQCDGENLCITGSYGSLQDVSGGKKAMSVTSVKNEKASAEHKKTTLSEMKAKVGLDDNRRFVEITKISPEPFTPEVESPESAAPKSPEGDESVSNQGNPQTETPKKGGQANGVSPEPSFTNFPANGSQEKFVGSIKVINDVLKLVVPESHVFFIEQNKNPYNQSEYLLHIHKDTLLRITGSNQIYMSDDGEQNVSFSINSVATEDGTNVYSKLEEMRDKLGLNKTTEVKVTIISSKQTTEAKSPANDGQPKSFTNQTTASAAPSGPSVS